MSDSRWFEEKPSKDLKAKIEHAADQELDRRDRNAREKKADSRRGLLAIFSFEILAAGAVASIAGTLGFWLAGDKQSQISLQANDDSDLFDDSLESDDIELVAELDLLEDFEILESLKDEELNT